jgi:hypothetical protein
MEKVESEPRRFKRYPYGFLRLRLVTPCLAVVLGIVLAVTNAGGVGQTGANNTTTVFICGLALIPLGIVFFLIALWMAKRGI